MKESHYLKDSDEYIALARQLTGFDDVDNSLIKEMLSLSKIRQYEPGELIIKEGDYDCWIYFLMEGEVIVKKGNKEIRHMRRAGDVFGEMGVIDGSPRSADIIAGDGRKTFCLAVDGSYMDRLSGSARLAFQAVTYRVFSEKLSERLRVMTEENIRLMEKLAEYEQKTCNDEYLRNIIGDMKKLLDKAEQFKTEKWIGE